MVSVREQPGLEASILEGWTFAGTAAPVPPRSIPWQSNYRVQGIGSNQVVTYLVGRSALSITAEEINPATLMRTGVVTSLATVATTSDAGVSRISVLPTQTAPVFVWVAHDGQSTFFRMETQNISIPAALSTTTVGPGAIARVDDLIHFPTTTDPNRWLSTGRCTGSCSFLSVMSTATGTVGRLMWGQYSTTQPTVSAPTVFTTITDPGGTPLFAPDSPIRAATDGNTLLYLAGQSATGGLVVERRDVASGARNTVFVSTGPLRLADLVRAQNGSGVYLLVSWSQSVSFGGTSFPSSMGSQGNVGVIRIDSVSGVSTLLFDLPLDQQAVAFARSGSFLVIALHEGPNAVLWRIPAL